MVEELPKSDWFVYTLGVVLIINQEGPVHCGGPLPGQVALGCMTKLAKQETESELAKSVPSWLLVQGPT